MLYICIYVAPWSCEARHLVPLYVHTCSGMTIKLNLTWLDFGNILLDSPSCGIREAKRFFFPTEYMPFKFESNLNCDNIYFFLSIWVFQPIWRPYFRSNSKRVKKDIYNVKMRNWSIFTAQMMTSYDTLILINLIVLSEYNLSTWSLCVLSEHEI